MNIFATILSTLLGVCVFIMLLALDFGRDAAMMGGLLIVIIAASAIDKAN